jgi:hypothetical protein
VQDITETAELRPGSTRKARADTAAAARRGPSSFARLDPANVLIGVAVLALALVLGAALADHSASSYVTRGIGKLPYVLILFAIAIPVVIAVWQRPQRGVLLVAAFIPFHGLLSIVPSKPPFAEGWKEALTLFTLAATFRPNLTRPARRPWPKVWQTAALYFLVGLVSAVIVGGTQGAVGLKIDYFWFLIAIVVWRQPLNAKDRDRLVSILIVDGVVTSLYGLWQQAAGAGRLFALGYTYNENIRFTGRFIRSFSSFPTPFNFAYFLTLVMLVALPVCLDDPRRPRSIAFFTVLPLLLVAQAFTFVRGAWLALGLGLAYLAIRRYRVLMLGAPLALVALLFLPGTFSTSALATGSFAERRVGWVDNISKVVSNPLGNGIGLTGASGAKVQQVDKNAAGFVYEPDNQYFKALYELGVIGLWALLLFFLSILLSLRRAERHLIGPDHALALGVTANFIGALAAAAISTWLEISPNETFLWLFLAVVLTAELESTAAARNAPAEPAQASTTWPALESS